MNKREFNKLLSRFDREKVNFSIDEQKYILYAKEKQSKEAEK